MKQLKLGLDIEEQPNWKVSKRYPTRREATGKPYRKKMTRLPDFDNLPVEIQITYSKTGFGK